MGGLSLKIDGLSPCWLNLAYFHVLMRIDLLVYYLLPRLP